MCDDDQPPLPPTCRGPEPWVNPWDTEPLVDWGTSHPVSYGGGTRAGIAMALSLLVLAGLAAALIVLAVGRCA